MALNETFNDPLQKFNSIRHTFRDYVLLHEYFHDIVPLKLFFTIHTADPPFPFFGSCPNTFKFYIILEAICSLDVLIYSHFTTTRFV